MSDRCPNCGVINDKRAKSCGYCRYDFKTGTVPPLEAVTEPKSSVVLPTGAESSMAPQHARSHAAIFGLILGIGSIGIGALISFFTSLSINLKGDVVPWLGFGVCALVLSLILSSVGLRNIACSKDNLAGKKAAILGLFAGVLGIVLYTTLIAFGVQHLEDENARVNSANNLKMIGIAIHRYHEVHDMMPPPVVYTEDGKPSFSWRVLLLPYLEEEGLYRQYNLNEPWDSPDNLKVLSKMPKVYAPVRGKTAEPNSTFYQVLVGKRTVFEDGKPTSRAWRSAVRFADITDGSSNTLMVVEGGVAVPWTKPDDLSYDDEKPIPRLGGLFDNGFYALFCDGSVRFMKRDLAEETLRQLITRNGSGTVDY